MNDAPGQAAAFLVTSFSLHPHQLAWLDARRSKGSLTRSAALRQVLDACMAADIAASQQQPHVTR